MFVSHFDFELANNESISFSVYFVNCLDSMSHDFVNYKDCYFAISLGLDAKDMGGLF